MGNYSITKMVNNNEYNKYYDNCSGWDGYSKSVKKRKLI